MELQVFQIALEAMEAEITEDPPRLVHHHVTIIITDRDDISFSIQSPDTIGLECTFILYPVHRWRARKYGMSAMLLCCVEELCHAFYLLPDGLPVQEKTIKVLRRVYPGASMESFYNTQP